MLFLKEKNMEFNPSIVLETKRLVLRYMNTNDKHDIFVNINNDKDVASLEKIIDSFCDK